MPNSTHLHEAAGERKIRAYPRLDPGEESSWRERYCADMRTRTLHGPEDYFAVHPEYRLWTWPQDIHKAVSRLNLSALIS